MENNEYVMMDEQDDYLLLHSSIFCINARTDAVCQHFDFGRGLIVILYENKQDYKENKELREWYFPYASENKSRLIEAKKALDEFYRKKLEEKKNAAV